MKPIHSFLGLIGSSILLSGAPSDKAPLHISDLNATTVVKIHQYLSDPQKRLKSDPKDLSTHYSWQHMSEFYPTAQITRGGSYTPLPRTIDPSIGALSFRGETVDKHLDTHAVDAFMVIHRGKIVYERYNTMYPEDKHIWWSSGKVIGSTLLAMLEAEGKVDVSRPVSHYLPELKNSVWDSVSVESALDMATGLNGTEHDEPGHDSRSNPKQVWYRWAVTIGMYANTIGLKDSPMEVIARMKKRTEPYAKFEYNSINTFIVNRIVEAVTHQPLHRYFSQHIWQKIGARNDGYVVTTPKEGYGLFYGMMNSTLEDMGRFGMIFTPSGRNFTQKSIVPPSVIKRIQTQPHQTMYNKAFMGQTMQKKFGETDMSNRYQWDAVFADGDFFKSGFGGQGLYVSPKNDTVVVWFGTNDGKGGEEAMARTIVKHLAKQHQ